MDFNLDMALPLKITDLGRMAYRDAWALQEQAHAEVLAGGPQALFLVEHPPVITLGRRPDSRRYLLADDGQLARAGVELVQSDRGGDITFHGPGQLVAYPIVRLNDHQLSVGGYVHRLEAVLIATLKHFGVAGFADPKAVGVWTEIRPGSSAKIAAIGVRIRRGVSMHGIALNVATDLDYFNLIVPCGLADRTVTSLRTLRGEASPGMDEVKDIFAAECLAAFTACRI
jgi:lipoyl(octanoyl) transferase